MALVGCSLDDQSNTDRGYLPSSWSAAEVVSLCDTTEFKTAPQELVMKYDGKTYYNKKVTRSGHEINVTFDFVSECCREFDIDYQLEENRLIIVYKPKDGDVCECKCNYRGIVNIGDKQIDFNAIRRITIERSS